MAGLNILLAATSLFGLGVADKVLEKVTSLPEGWRQLDQAPDGSQVISLSIAMRQPHLHKMTTHLMTEGAPLSRDETNEMQAADQKDIEAVMKWLSGHGISGSKADKGWVHVQTTVDKAQPLLDMKLGRYEYETNPPVLRTREYGIPDDLADAIDFIHPIANFMTPKNDILPSSPPPSHSHSHQRDLTIRNRPSCGQANTPQCIRDSYNLNYNPPSGPSPVRMGIAGFLGNYVDYEDMHNFLEQMAPKIASTGYNFSVQSVNGGQNPQDPMQAGFEASLDMQYAMSLAFPAAVTFYSCAGLGPELNDQGQPITNDTDINNEPYLELLQYLLNQPTAELPHVLSISYADNEDSVPKPYAQRVCSMFGMLTSRGVSILSGSGDGGSSGAAANGTCHTNDGTNKDVTMAAFPASCPWITAVGAVTNVGPPPLEGASFSTGGFSQYFPQPSWQSSAVANYVQELDGHLAQYYNESMRATPDISAVGMAFPVLSGERWTWLQGTSASTPLVASMIALINDARLRRGTAPLGWLNQKLYSPNVIKVLTDVTEGQSQSCVFANGEQPGGWPALKGWDAITGLGVPADFAALMEVLLNA